MKNKDLFLIILVFLLFSSCSDEKDKLEKTDDNDESFVDEYDNYDKPSALYIMLAYSTHDTLWSTGNNIKWYNAKTDELKFHKIPISMVHSLSIIVFLDDKQLISFDATSNVSSNTTHYPCIIGDDDGKYVYRCKCGNKQDHVVGPTCEWRYEYTGTGGQYRISKGYPRWDPREEEREEYYDPWWGTSWASRDSIREENWKAIEPEWNIFIEQLKKEGRYRE